MHVAFAKLKTREEVFKIDFLRVKATVGKKGKILVTPEWKVIRSKDLMVHGKAFKAVWDEPNNIWSLDEHRLLELIDAELRVKTEEVKRDNPDKEVSTLYLQNYNDNAYRQYRQYIASLPDSFRSFDDHLTFAHEVITKDDYVSKRLPYDLQDTPCPAWDEIVGTLYDPQERRKIEWAIGSIFSGDSRHIQKLLVFYGDAGAGKSTILNIIQKLFEGYYTTFEAKSIGSNNNTFSTDAFRSNPLVAIQHDGDLSGIEDNSKLNSIVSHEEMQVNEKYKPSYTSKFISFLMMATNKPVKITDSKSGMIRRLIDVTPSGKRIPTSRYWVLMNQIDFELGAIGSHCLEVYEKLGEHYYDSYIPFEMMMKTDVFFNFVEESYPDFAEEDGTSLKRAYAKYKQYCDDTNVSFKLPMYKFREELKDYFREFKPYVYIDGRQIRSYYQGFLTKKFEKESAEKQKLEEKEYLLELTETKSIFDEIAADWPAQYAGDEDKPTSKWDNVTTKLADLDTTKVHYVRVPENHIVIDFDLKNEKGEKDADKNLRSASKWPPTYAEYSKGGAGIHLHYIYDGDVSSLSSIYSPGIEIKRFSGKASLRRRVSRCNNLPIAHISSGLPKKEVKSVINADRVKSEKGLRSLIERNLRKEIHPGTKPSIDFIYKILEDAYNDGLAYDVTDMRPKILAFAAGSTNHAQYCISLVSKMRFMSKDIDEAVASQEYPTEEYESDELVFFDVEVFPNLFLINWKYAGEDKKCVRMINPTPEEVGKLFKFKLVGFNCRRYDNHIMYARYLGYTNEQLFELSKKIVSGGKKDVDRNCFFREAYNISYTDVYDFASAVHKQSLKKWEIDLGIHHQELGLPWDQPVPEDKWELVAKYCDNDVISTEVTFNHLKGDFAARKILAKLSGLTVNDTTNSHSTKIIFGADRTPQDLFNYRDLSRPVKYIDDDVKEYLKEHSSMNLEEGFELSWCDGEKSLVPYFPGYRFSHGKSEYRGFTVGEGGFVYSEPGMYWDVALLDVASMHPTSVESECLFGPSYSETFSDIKNARIAIKHKDRDALSNLLDGDLLEFYDEAVNGGEFSLDDLSNALKTVINSVYGLTSASFDNPFRDRRNIDNIVAKRGALFMIDLLYEVQKRGFTVAHIKTDSIKIPNATDEIIQFVMDFGKRYGYIFELESVYDRMCLVNKAVYIAKGKSGKHAGEWTPTGAQFAHPYVFKTLFSGEPLEFKDYCETRAVSKGALVLDMNERNPEEHNYQFVGRIGLFCPIKSGFGGGLLMVNRDEKYDSATGTIGYRWLESETVKTLEKEKDIDEGYFRGLVDEARNAISKYGDIEQFLYGRTNEDIPPWCVNLCDDCPKKKECTELSSKLESSSPKACAL